MSAFKPTTVAQTQIDLLVSDGDAAVLKTALEGAISTTQTAITNAVAPKATSVEVAGVSALAAQGFLDTASVVAPKATSAEVADLSALATQGFLDVATAIAGQVVVAETGNTAVTTAQTAITTAITTSEENVLIGVEGLVGANAVDVKDTVLAAIAAAGPQSGDIKLIANSTGLAPTGYTRASGVFAPISGSYDQCRFWFGTYAVPAAATAANNSSHIFAMPCGGGGTAYNLNTGATYSTTSNPGGGGSGGSCGLVANADYVYSFGGVNAAASLLYADVRRYSIAGNTWGSLVSLPAVRHKATCGELGNGNFAVVGGLSAAAMTIANMTETMYVLNPTTNTIVTTVTLGFRSFDGRSLKLANGSLLVWFAANMTTNGPGAGSAYVATTRAFIIDTAYNVTEVDGLGGLVAYELADGRVVSIWSTPASSRVHDFTQALGAQSSPYVLNATGLALGAANAWQSMQVMAGPAGAGQLPCPHATLSPMFSTRTAAAHPAQSFYVYKV